jgi:uncharacterized membrane protein YcaP (DUF421 family)
MSGGEFDLSMPWWEFALRGVTVYLVVLVMLRLTGKRSFGDLSAFDIVVLMVVGGSLRTAIIGKDASWLGPLIAVAAILMTNKAIGWLSARFPKFNRWVEGKPSILARDGLRDPRALRRHDVADAEFDRELHAAGLQDESNVVLAQLEPNGKITLIREKSAE